MFRLHHFILTLLLCIDLGCLVSWLPGSLGNCFCFKLYIFNSLFILLGKRQLLEPAVLYTHDGVTVSRSVGIWYPINAIGSACIGGGRGIALLLERV